MKYLLGIILTIFAANALAQPVMNDQEFSAQFRLARVYEETRDLTNAVRIYVELHKAKPNFPEISEGLYRCLYSLKRFAEAEQVVRDRIASEGENFELYLDLARTLAKENKKTEAIEAFRDAEKHASDIHPYSVAINVSQAMVDVGYTEEALEYLRQARKTITDGGFLTGEIGSLLFKIGKYEDGTKEYLSLLEKDENQLSYIQSRIAVFTADTMIRKTILTTITSSIDINDANIPQLRLLAWSYGEMKDYRNSYNVILALDDKMSARGGGSGSELYGFAERVRSEGAYEVAAMAYDEAIKRLRKTTTGDVRAEFFMSQAELGALQTRSQFVLAKEHPEKAELDSLVMRFEAYADSKRQPDLILQALSRAGEIAFRYSFNLEGAKRIYNKVVVRSSGISERTREALFSLEEIALAQGKLDTARTELAAISDILARRNRKEDEESRKRLLFELARIDYYSGEFDSAFSKLNLVAADPASEYANDAIGLRSHIEENREAGNETALKLFARAELEVLGRNYVTALSAYQSIRDASPNAPVADDAILRSADLLVLVGKPTDAVHILEEMQDKMSTSPLADQAGFRAAEIVEKEIKDKPRAEKMYEDFLERYDKSPLCTEARKRARKLRGDSF